LTIEKLAIICGKIEDHEKTIKHNKKEFTGPLDRTLMLAYSSDTIKEKIIENKGKSGIIENRQKILRGSIYDLRPQSKAQRATFLLLFLE
jgi:hypothetical protein